MAVVNSNKKFPEDFIQRIKEISEREDIFEDLSLKDEHMDMDMDKLIADNAKMKLDLENLKAENKSLKDTIDRYKAWHDKIASMTDVLIDWLLSMDNKPLVILPVTDKDKYEKEVNEDASEFIDNTIKLTRDVEIVGRLTVLKEYVSSIETDLYNYENEY